ncbi:cytochrome P450 [Spiractinospora alimapuensis]|uniref:cytochrome P450 n=1 Tax=Spiractinospora alimapuensis TaxID=2820884 RepID=UPI001F30663D|nr:cytochrome P450 [Spiractinospora alimapuensis]QVQ51181.1 cytochrome P450 [Spiractinospora alimapuensis]
MRTEPTNQDETNASPVPRQRTGGCPFRPPAELEERHARGPLSPLAYLDGHVGWLVTGLEEARAVLADPRFSTNPNLKHDAVRPPGVGNDAERGEVRPGSFGQMDPPEHTRLRRLLTGQFTVRRMRTLEPRIEEITASRLDAMEEAGPPADLVSTFALPIPSLVICELLGVPYTDHDLFQDLTTRLLSLIGATEDVAAAGVELGRYLRGQARRQLADPGDNILGGLAASGEVTEEELTHIALTLLVAGHETTANQIALGVFSLLQHPDHLAALRSDPDLTETAVEELLRFHSIVHLGAPNRVALEDVEVAGTLIRAGQGVTVSVPAVNRDPSVFPDPHSLRFDRERPRQHLALGHGIHQCLGQQLARIELRIAFRALLDRFPTLRLAVAADDVPVRDDALVLGLRELPVTWERDTTS